MISIGVDQAIKDGTGLCMARFKKDGTHED